MRLPTLDPALRSKAAEPWITRLAPAGAGLAIALIIVLLSILLLLLDKDERNYNRQQLIRDVLWVEQSLQFQFDSERTRILRLARDVADGDLTEQAFVAQARQYAQILPDLVDIVWLDDQRGVVASSPRTDPVRLAADLKPFDGIAIDSALGVYSAPYQRPDGQSVLAFAAPVAKDGKGPTGKIIAVFGLDQVLVHQVPWWIAEKRAVTLKDANGKVLATRSTVMPDASASAHEIELGPPLHDIGLMLTSYRERRSIVQNGLVAAMVVLALAAALGLLARERQLRKRRAAEAALDDEHTLRRAMESSLLVGIRARDLTGRMVYVNEAFCRMVGYAADELLGRYPPMPYWVPEQFELTQRAHDAVLAGETTGQGIELKFQHRDGKQIDVLIYEAPLIDAQGVHRGWMGSVLDISDRKRAEEFARAQGERMQHTARLVTMGEMASLLAHDLNQPLATIRSYQAGLVNRLQMPDLTREEVDAALKAIDAAAARAGLIIRRVHEFVKRREPRLEPVQLSSVIREAVALLGPEMQKMHTLAGVTIEPDLPGVRADQVLLQQVLVNLIRNGLDAMTAVAEDARRIAIVAVKSDPRHVLVSVSDAGAGVAADVAQQLFQPFMSTKRSGMGMGLSICRSIIELHGGRIQYEPGLHGGSTFSFSLPISDDEA